MKEYGMGWKPSPFDPNDYSLESFIPKFPLSLSLVQEKLWLFPIESLNQLDTPHCVGFSIADFSINLPTFVPQTNQDGDDFYYMCKVKDREPRQETGSNLRSAAKVMKDLKKINAYAFTSSMDSIKWWLLNRGPLIAGTLWTSGMYETDANFIIRPSGDRVGGHAYLLNGWDTNDYISIQNSWGKDWGLNGQAYIHASDFEQLLRQGGEVITAVEIPPGFFKGCRKYASKFKR